MNSKILMFCMLLAMAGLTTIISCSEDDEPVPEFTVGGTVSGASGSLVLVMGNEELTVSGDGNFTFATKLLDGAQYNVTVKSAPEGQYAEVSNGSGTISGASVSNVSVTCIDIPEGTYTVGGTVDGLTGTVVIANNNVDELTITTTGSFTFGTPLADGSNYEVTIVTQPDGELCSVTNGSGTINGANVTDVSITCEAVPEVEGGNYYAVDLDKAKLHQFQADKTLLAKSGTGLTDFNMVTGLAYDSDNDILYGFSQEGVLLSINRATGEGTNIGDVATKEIFDLAYDKNADKLYGVNYSFGQLLEINVTNGEITSLYTDPGLEGVYGLAYDPNNDKLYGTSSNEELLLISIAPAAPTVIGDAQEVFRGLGYDSGNDILYGIVEQNQGDDVLSIWNINTSSAFPIVIDKTGVLNNQNQGFGAGLTYVDGDNQLLASSGLMSPARLYEVDEGNGMTVSVGSSGYNIFGDLAVRDTDKLMYSLVITEDLLVTFDAASGTTTFKRELNLNANANFVPGFTYKAADDIFYALALAAPAGVHLAIIDAASNAPPVMKDGVLSVTSDGIRALAYDNGNGKLYAATLTGIAEIDEEEGTIIEGSEVSFFNPQVILAMNFDPVKEVLVATTAESKVIAINPATGNVQEITTVDAGVELVGITYKE